MKNAFKEDAAVAPPDLADLASIGYPTDGDPGSDTPATLPGAAWFYMITMEILNVVLAAGVVPSTASVTQLRDAIEALITTGSASAIFPAGMAAHDLILAVSGAAFGRLAMAAAAGKPLLSGGTGVDPAWGGDADFVGSLLKNSQLQGFINTKQALSIASNVLTLDYKSGNVIAFTHNANITTMTLNNIPASGKFAMLTFLVTYNGGTPTWAWLTSTVKWSGGSPPPLTYTSGKIDAFTVWTVDGGSTWYGSAVGQNF